MHYDNNEEQYNKIKEMKISSNVEILAKDCHEEFAFFLNYVRDLKFEEKPDYSFLKKLLRNIADKENIFYDFYNYDWVTLKPIDIVILN